MLNKMALERIKMIDSYHFGRIIIDEKEYTSDVIIFPERVKAGWWRLEGHALHIEDVEDVIGEKPEVLIIGTGYAGMMRVLTATRQRLESEGIELIIEKTQRACETYNKLSKSKKVVAALHLTC